MVNDAILKTDTINRLRKEYAATPDTDSPKESLAKAIAKTGEIRHKTSQWHFGMYLDASFFLACEAIATGSFENIGKQPDG